MKQRQADALLLLLLLILLLIVLLILLLLSLLLLLLLSYIIIILLFRFFTAGQSTRHRKHLHPTSFHFAPHSRAFVSSIRLLVVCCLQLFEEGEKYSSNESRGRRV